jgi:hypothetical protein
MMVIISRWWGKEQKEKKNLKIIINFLLSFICWYLALLVHFDTLHENKKRNILKTKQKWMNGWDEERPGIVTIKTETIAKNFNTWISFVSFAHNSAANNHQPMSE